MINIAKKWVQVPANISSSDHRFFVFCNSMFIFAFFAHIIFVPLFYQMGDTIVFINNILAIFLDVLCLTLNYRGFLKSATAIWIFEISAHTNPPVNKLDYSTLQLIHGFNAVANFVGIAYASYYYRRYSEQMEAKLLHLANTDPLTGICNRRFFEQTAEKKLKQTSSSGIKECALLLLDIETLSSIMARSDQALYRAKNSGRNKVVV